MSTKRGRSTEREGWNTARRGAVDQASLTAALDRLLADHEAGTADHEPGGVDDEPWGADHEPGGADDAARSRRRGPAARADRARAFPAGATGRWVPVGPSVVRRGQAMDRPRVSGRIRDLQVSDDGTRAYAASAKGGVWCTEDAGATWAPVGGWAERGRSAGGPSNAQSCGCLLVSFGPLSALDVVLVGTGEPIPSTGSRTGGYQGGVGVLAALGPAAPVGAGHDPWERDSGLGVLEGQGAYRLVRDPAARAWSASGVDQDRVLACTSGGAYLGTRQAIPAGGGLPARDGYVWGPLPGLWSATVGSAAFFTSQAVVTDGAWLAGGPNGRIVLAVRSFGLVYSDDLGVTFRPVPTLNQPVVPVRGRLSMALAPGTRRAYVLGDNAGAASVWRIPDLAASPPVATPVGPVPTVWGNPLSATSRDYDQALAVDVVAGTDRLYLGGSVTMPRPSTNWGASLWCFDVSAVPDLQPTAGVSRSPVPGPSDGADIEGLVGNNVHGDVHAIRIPPGPAAANRAVWVGCDGGVYISERAGQVNSFRPSVTGLAALETGFVAVHPTSSHYLAAGAQDNGTLVRAGDTVWEEILQGDGGGTLFHPTAPQVLVGQYINATWRSTSTAAFWDPMQRRPGWPNHTTVGREGGGALSLFYSGASAVATSATRSRLALGTNRVWVSEDIGAATPNTWAVLPWPNGATSDPRPAGADPVAQHAVGVPVPGLGQVVTLAWVTPTELLVAYAGGIVRYTESPPGTWTSKVWALTDPAVALPLASTITDLAPVPASGQPPVVSHDFYVTTTGSGTDPTVESLWFLQDSADTFHPTGLRRQLDPPAPPAPAGTTGPLDPAYAVVVDPLAVDTVYVGTATGVWRGRRTAPTGAHGWAPFVNGLPQATVQDLKVWTDPAGAAAPAHAPRLLRAAVQSRGVWEVDLAHDAQRHTYLRVHARDDRRWPVSPLADPRLAATAPAEPAHASPDITVRPRWPRTSPPRFPGSGTMRTGNAPAYPVWTFQTAFRWLYPSVQATGEFTEAFGDLVAHHRGTLGRSVVPRVDRALWESVVGGSDPGSGVRLGSPTPDTLVASTAAADPLAVYRAPWQVGLAPDLAATEVDLVESVVAPRGTGGVWSVYAEPSSVDVLLHHRDSRTVPRGGAYAVLLWRSARRWRDLMGLGVADVVAFRAAAAGGAGGVAAPAGWTAVVNPAGIARATLPAPLDARMPRAVTFDVDLTAERGRAVLFLALVGSDLDDPGLAPAGVPATVRDLVLGWPCAAARVVRVVRRPGS